MRNLSLFTVAAVASTMFLQGCAGVSSMESEDMASAPNHMFTASKVQVIDATKSSIETLGYNFKNMKDADPTTEIYFSKPMSAFSWGEVGRIDVRSVGDASTMVSIASEKRYQVQITGTSQDEFSRKLFTEIQKELSK